MFCTFDLTEANFDLYAVRHYDNPTCTGMDEFYDDILRFKYIRRLFNKYEESGEMRENLMINHLVVLYNLFGDATTKMLFYKVDEKHWPVLVPFLIFLNRMPEKVSISKDRLVFGIDIQIDITTVDKLRKVLKCKC